MAKKDDQTREVENKPEETRSSEGVTPDSKPKNSIDELTADLQRLQADFANFKRRTETEKSELLDFAKTRVVREFLAVRDNFDRELANRPAELKDSPWAASIDSIRASFDAVLKSLGVVRFESVGEPFNPHLHEAISSDGDGDIVSQEMQPGYKLGDTILRPAIVTVGGASNPDPANVERKAETAPGRDTDGEIGKS